MLRFLSYLLLVSVLICGVQIHAKEIYVNNATGHDRNLGQSPDTVDILAGPVKTITRAIELSGPGDTIIIAPTDVPYKETLCLFGKKQSGDEFNAFTIEGNGAVLDGTELLPIGVWSHAFGNTFRFQPTKFTHFQIFESGQPLKRIAVEPVAKRPPHLNPMEWCICNGFLYVCLDNFKRPQDYRFSYSDKMTGITVMQTDNVRINDLIVQGFQVDGIAVVNNTKNVVFDNVILRGNGRNGLSIGAASSVSVGYSLLGDNRATQIEMAERSELLLFLTELNGVDSADLSQQAMTAHSTRLAQSIQIINNQGTLRRIGPEGVSAVEAAGKPDIANLWGNLVVATLVNQAATAAPSTLTSVRTTPNDNVRTPAEGQQPVVPVDEQPIIEPNAVPDDQPAEDDTTDSGLFSFDELDDLSDDPGTDPQNADALSDEDEENTDDKSPWGDNFDLSDSPFGDL